MDHGVRRPACVRLFGSRSSKDLPWIVAGLAAGRDTKSGNERFLQCARWLSEAVGTCFAFGGFRRRPVKRETLVNLIHFLGHQDFAHERIQHLEPSLRQAQDNEKVGQEHHTCGRPRRVPAPSDDWLFKLLSSKFSAFFATEVRPVSKTPSSNVSKAKPVPIRPMRFHTDPNDNSW